MRRVIVFALAIVSLCMFPRFAFAAGTEQVVSDASENVMVVAYTRFNAALIMLGVSPDDARLDATAKAKLSNASTGGRFYELVQSIEQYNGVDTDDVFGSVGFGVLRLPWVAYCLAYDMHIYTYAGTRSGALEDLQTVLAGGDLGGGSGGDESDGYLYFSGFTPFVGNGTFTGLSSASNRYFIDNSNNRYYFLKGYQSDNQLVPNDLTIAIPDTFLPDYTTYDYYLFVQFNTSGTSKRYGYILTRFTKNSGVSFVSIDNNNGSVYYYLMNTIGTSISYESQSTSNISSYDYDSTRNIMYLNNMDVTFYNNSLNNNGNVGYRNSSGETYGYYSAKLTSGGVIPLPPSNWPDNPVVTTPEPPDVPTDTPVYPPQVTGPDVTVPQTPDLSDVLDALNEHCEHLQDAIYNGFNDYYETITDYYSDVLDWLQEWMEYFDRVFDDAFDDIKLYQQTGNYWLNQIYNKLDDINKKLDVLGNKLESDDIPSSYDDSNVATDGSSVLAGAYNSLRTKFPFSLLDSLANFATLLKHQAVAPDFDLPVGNPFGSNDPFTVEIDLTPYSDWAAIVRTGEVLAVYVALARRAAAMWTREGEGA